VRVDDVRKDDIPLASVYAFGEQVRRLQVVGMALIIIGIACVLSGD
jgi:multidrug transporter EmrE-like cation transporter